MQQPKKCLRIKEIELDVSSVDELFMKECSIDDYCSKQRDVILGIFRHFGMDVDESKHECKYESINCNQNDLVEYLWIGKSCHM